MKREELKQAVKTSKTLADVCKKMRCEGSYNNIRRLIKKYEFDTSHFTQVKHGKEERICPVCESAFNVWASDTKVTCSYSCSNTYFRSGENNGMYKTNPTNYRTICWRNNEKKCIICGEDKIVAVHHYDGNHENNDISNLIPLCPTHHQYMHSKYRNLIENKVKQYLNEIQIL